MSPHRLRLVSKLITKADPSPPIALKPTQQDRVRKMVDRLQVLVLTHPVVAMWLLEWVDRFIDNQLK